MIIKNDQSTTEISEALDHLKNLSEYPTPYTQYARVLLIYINDLNHKLCEAENDCKELTHFKNIISSSAERLKEGNPVKLESLFNGELASSMFATLFASEFVRSKATNFFEQTFSIPNAGDFTVTIQKAERKTPGMLISELKDSLENANVRLEGLETISETAKELISRIALSNIDKTYRDLAALFGVSTTDLPPPDRDNLFFTVTVPRPPRSGPGWQVDPDFISKVQDGIGHDEESQCWEGTPSMEVVEAVLLAAAAIKQSV